MKDRTKARLKRWAKGLLILLAAWAGAAGEFPLGQYDAEPKQDGDDE
jgi:hypothetical protein